MPDDQSPSSDPRSEFIDAAVWHGTLDRAREILAAHPEVASGDVHTAALLGDHVAVARFLAKDAANATAKGGPRNWDALTYLCFSRFLRLEPARTEGFLAAATALLDAGADPNTGFFEENHQPKPEFESALYGAAGVAHHPELTKLLLDRGADPNDGEVAYHSPETLDNRTIHVLVESGKLTQDTIALMLARKFNWHDDEGVHWLLERGADANWLLWGSRPLHYALRHGTPIRYFEWLLDHGADPGLVDKNGIVPPAQAARQGRADVLALFEKRGFVIALGGDDAFLAACARANADEANSLAATDPTLVGRMQSQNPGLLADFAGAGNTAAVRLMLDLGFDPGMARVKPDWVAGETALHVAVAHGCPAVADLLIARGAPLEAKRHGGRTPLRVAFLCLEQQSEWTPNEHTLPIAEKLIEAGASVEDAGLTLTAAVCLGRSDDVARLAADAGADERQKPLAAAAYNGRLDAIDTALALGADPNAPNAGLNPNATALHNAVCSGSLAAVRRLVEAGANVEGKDGPYQATPQQWAEYFVRESVAGKVEYFQREGARRKQYAEIAEYLRRVSSQPAE
ncbi:MAG: ankyrin repeat domain-containing protein [Candidatus Solibacter sp.]